MSLSSIKAFFNLFLAEGIFLLILGSLVILLPRLTTFVLAMVLSFGLILLGIYKFINAIRMRHHARHSAIKAVTSVLIMLIGAYLILNPFFNIMFLTIGIGIYFILEGINCTVIAIQNRHKLKYWWATFFFSLMQFLLAFIIIFGLPYTALWTLGILIGINLVFSGISLILIYIDTKPFVQNKSN